LASVHAFQKVVEGKREERERERGEKENFFLFQEARGDGRKKKESFSRGFYPIFAFEKSNSGGIKCEKKK
jgi:hypothetical protein